MVPSLKGICVMYPLTRGRTSTFWMAARRPVYSECSTIFFAIGRATVTVGGRGCRGGLFFASCQGQGEQPEDGGEESKRAHGHGGGQQRPTVATFFREATTEKIIPEPSPANGEAA